MSIKKKIKIFNTISIKKLSVILNIDPIKIINICNSLGIIVTSDYILNKDLIELILDEFGYKVEFIQDNINTNNIKFNGKYKRPPIVTIVGHVNHGKTSLLEFIRNINMRYKEYGNITQHIDIFNVKLKNKHSITFIDTPGHESFITLRNRALKISDIVLIIISSNSGIMEQTLECINNARSLRLPIIFVFSKIDKKNSNINKIKEELSNINILVKDWGGEYITQEVSVKNGYGIDLLIEKILKVAKTINLYTDLNVPCKGTIIESSLDKNKGFIVKILIEKGILKLGDHIISGIYYGNIKKIYNDKKNYKKVYPSIPVNVIGFNGAPLSGDSFNILDDEKKMKLISNQRLLLINKDKIKYISKNINNKNILNIILKCDVNGSVDVISDQINKLSIDNDISINIIKKSVGNITSSDILLANISKSIIIGFNIKININKKKPNKSIGNIYIFKIIYDIIDFLKNIISNKKKPNIIILGKAKVIEIFNINNKKIFGCILLNGIINKNYKIKILRENNVIYDGEILSIKRFNNDLIEINKKGYNFGIIIKSFDKIKINDIITCYNI
ncbi:MAG: translation initiation factor IF-2 [Candidatus Shikimatogenerans bostrichidophilus]|nr:MAG: translation initiation factor IF-2 [Candidatus Shikimatogenerans bostrichidophilus]